MTQAFGEADGQSLNNTAPKCSVISVEAKQDSGLEQGQANESETVVEKDPSEQQGSMAAIRNTTAKEDSKDAVVDASTMDQTGDHDNKDHGSENMKSDVEKLLNVQPSEDIEKYSDEEIEIEIDSDGDRKSELGSGKKSESESSSETSDESSDSESSDNEDQEEDIANEEPDFDENNDISGGPVRSANEVVDEKAPELPEDYKIREEEPIEFIGTITAAVERSVIVKACILGEFRVLEENSVFCFEDKSLLGVLFETFGRLQAPMYRVKFNSDETFEKFKNKVGEKVYYVVPESKFLYTDTIKNLKFTDASNCHDEELPLEEQEFSDDEQEQAAKSVSKKRKKNKRKQEDNHNDKKSLPNPSGNTGNLSSKSASFSHQSYGYAPGQFGAKTGASEHKTYYEPLSSGSSAPPPNSNYFPPLHNYLSSQQSPYFGNNQQANPQGYSAFSNGATHSPVSWTPPALPYGIPYQPNYYEQNPYGVPFSTSPSSNLQGHASVLNQSNSQLELLQSLLVSHLNNKMRDNQNEETYNHGMNANK